MLKMYCWNLRYKFWDLIKILQVQLSDRMIHCLNKQSHMDHTERL